MVSKGMRKFVLLLLTVCVLSACDKFIKDKQPAGEVIHISLEEFVEAIHYAVDTAADSPPDWAKADKEHMDQTCESLSSTTAKACAAMTQAALPLCSSNASKVTSAYADQEICGGYMSGKDTAVICTTEADPTTTTWCHAANRCKEARKESEGACRVAKAMAAPTLKMAELRVAVDDKSQKSGKVSVILFTAGGGRSLHASNVVVLKLKPRPKKSYNIQVATAAPKTLDHTDDAQRRGKELAELITSAFNASMLCVKEKDAKCEKRPPLAGSDISITFSLIAKSDKEIGIKKEWSSVPAGIELGASASREHANTLTITYGRDE